MHRNYISIYLLICICHSLHPTASTLKFGKGGYQGCRGGNGSDWYLENVLELLDSANEHYYDAPTRTLYYQPNSTTGGPPASFTASAPQLMTLLMVNQTQQQPLKGLTIKGIGFRDTAPTYLEPHAVPSGGTCESSIETASLG
jgi:hypothetical protein